MDRIVSVTAKEIQTEKLITGEEFFIAGHFPGAAIFPGAMMQELSTQSAGILIASKYNPMQTSPLILGVGDGQVVCLFHRPCSFRLRRHGPR